MSQERFAFIGFGEVGAVFSAALRAQGAEVAATDVLLERPGGVEMLRARARAEGIRFAPLADAVATARWVLSTVTTEVAAEAARSVANHLVPGQVYLDLNATAPSVKREIAGLLESAGADFVEGAILGAVGVSGAGTRILLGGGDAARDAAETLAGRYGLDVVHYSEEIGRASTFKMLRSVFSKGMEALLLEFLIAARRAGLEEDLWREAVELFERDPFEAVASNWMRSHAVAHRRRHHEMGQVAELVRELGLDPLMTAATARLFARSTALGLADAFPEGAASMDEVVAFMERRLGEPPGPPDS